MRELMESLAALERGAGSPGEKQAAEMLRDAFADVGAKVQIDEEEFRGENYSRMLMPLGVIGLLANRLVLRGRRFVGGSLAATVTALIVDDVDNRRRVWRRLVARPQTTWNVVAEVGDLSSDRTLVVMGHHDAAPTGRIFDPSGQRWIAKKYPKLIEGTDTGSPFWWPVIAGPVLTVVSALLGSRAVGRIGSFWSILATAIGIDIARHRVVPGANDNLSGSVALVSIAERLKDVRGIRVVLASCGAEEVLQGGVYGFVERHMKPLDKSRTWMLNLDTIGSPELILVEGEGPFLMHDYCDPAFRDRIARVAESATGRPLYRGVRARASSDSIIPSRAGYPTAMLGSWEPGTKIVSNYHLPTDVPENLSYETIERAVTLADALARDLSGT
ncbi:MAG: M28 family metallopeptidase [Solirubrobacteraceae bacterium]